MSVYPEVVDYLLQTYAKDDVIVEADTASTRYNEPQAKSPAQYAEALETKSLRSKVFTMSTF